MAFSFSSKVLFGAAPTCLSTTSPFLMKITVGTLRTPKRMAKPSFSSTSHLPMTACSLYSSANASISGPIFLHGPHHVAQKSTTTGLPEANNSSKFESVIANAIVLFLLIVCYY